MHLRRSRRALRRDRRGPRLGAASSSACGASCVAARADEQLPTTVAPAAARRRQASRTRPGVYVEGLDDVHGAPPALLHPGAGRPDRRVRHPGPRRDGPPRRTAPTPSRSPASTGSGSSRSSGTADRRASSWPRIEVQGPRPLSACSPTWPGCSPSTTSTSSQPGRPRTGPGEQHALRVELADPRTWTRSSAR